MDERLEEIYKLTYSSIINSINILPEYKACWLVYSKEKLDSFKFMLGSLIKFILKKGLENFIDNIKNEVKIYFTRNIFYECSDTFTQVLNDKLIKDLNGKL